MKIGIFLLLTAVIRLQAASVAITMDDFYLDDGPLLNGAQKDQRILEVLHQEGVQAALFVQAGNLIDLPVSRHRLSHWDKAGHLIANHTYSHLNYNHTTFERFSEDVMR